VKFWREEGTHTCIAAAEHEELDQPAQREEVGSMGMRIDGRGGLGGH
jgi:hypothetical protein